MAPWPHKEGPMKTVLVVDDEECIRSVIRDVLENPDCRVLEAADAASGLDLARLEMPDLILLDYCMPGTSGTQVVERLQQGPTAYIPVILMSGLGDITMFSIIANNAAAYLIKPFSRTELLMKMNEVMIPSVPAGSGLAA